MRQPWQDLCVVHDTTAFTNIGSQVSGVRWYSDRALLLPAGLAVIEKGIDPAYLKWLKSPGVQLGPKEIVQVDGPNLWDGLEADREALDKVASFLRLQSGRIQPFVMTLETQEFFRRNGIGRRQIHGAPLEISRVMNDKAALRHLVDDTRLFPPNVSTRDPETVMATVKKRMALPSNELDFVVVKRTNLAGGDGILFLPLGSPYEEAVTEFMREQHANDIRVVARRKGAHEYVLVHEGTTRERGEVSRLVHEFLSRPEKEVCDVIVYGMDILGNTSTPPITRQDDIEARLGSFLTKHSDNEIIIEYGYDSKSFSTQLMMDEGKGMHFLGVTEQIVDECGRHLGNKISRRRHPDRMPKEDWVTMEQYSRLAAGLAHESVNGYSGTIGFDFIKRKRDGSIYMIECNGRQTAATYPIAVSHQLEGRRPVLTIGGADVNWGVMMLNGVTTTTRSFGELAERLGSKLLFEGTSGAIPFNIRLMGLPSPKCGIITVADSIEQAEEMMKEVKLVLDPPPEPTE